MQNISRTNTRRQVGHELLFCAWLTSAAGGERYEYHRGFLAKDIEDGPKRRLGDTERKLLERLAERVRWAADKGCVHLVRHLPSRNRSPDPAAAEFFRCFRGLCGSTCSPASAPNGSIAFSDARYSPDLLPSLN